jgi:hypothetical protein
LIYLLKCHIETKDEYEIRYKYLGEEFDQDDIDELLEDIYNIPGFRMVAWSTQSLSEEEYAHYIRGH